MRAGLSDRAAASRKCELTASSQAICATRYWLQLITECAGSCTERTAADRPRAFACPDAQQSQIHVIGPSFGLNLPLLESIKRSPRATLPCCATQQPRLIADQSIDSLQRQHTGHNDSTVLICNTDRCFSGRESFTTQGSSLWSVAMEPASRLQPTKARESTILCSRD